MLVTHNYSKTSLFCDILMQYVLTVLIYNEKHMSKTLDKLPKRTLHVEKFIFFGFFFKEIQK